jgi:MFS family permease
MVPELGTTSYIAGIGLGTYCLGFGVVPLVTASLSEEFGRMPLYLVSAAGFAMTHLMIALYVAISSSSCSNILTTFRAPNITTVIIGRFLNGAFGSTGATMVGGSVADIWAPKE